MIREQMNRERLTAEEVKFLSAFETQFACVIDGHYLRGVPRSDAEAMGRIYNRIFHTNRRHNISCGACLYNLINAVGTAYREDKPKRGRPKKNANV